MSPTLDFYFDFISPYSFLASQRLEAYPGLKQAAITYKPVAFGSMLSRLGVKGPGEIAERRRQGLIDVMLLCQHYGLKLSAPPTHPFNSVYALRMALLLEGDARAQFVKAAFKAAWSDGLELGDPAVLKQLALELGLDLDPEAAASDPGARKSLKANTQELLSLGGWGLPSFVFEGQLYFGHDRLELLEAAVLGKVKVDPSELETLLRRTGLRRIDG